MAEVTYNADGTVLVELVHPISPKGQPQISSVTLRRLTAGDLIETDMATSGPRKLQALLVRIAQLPPSTVAMIDAEDFDRIDQEVAKLLGKSK